MRNTAIAFFVIVGIAIIFNIWSIITFGPSFIPIAMIVVNLVCIWVIVDTLRKTTRG